MKKTAAIGALVVAPALVLGSSMAQAAMVTYSNFVDGDGTTALFDPAETQANASGNTLTIYVNNFVADGSSSATYSALDTLTFTITAPAGYVITNVKYVEGGNGSTSPGGVALATGSIVVSDVDPDGTYKFVANFVQQLFTGNSNSGWTITPGGTGGIGVPNLEGVRVSIVNSLFAVAGAGSTATIGKDNPSLAVSVALIPLPPSVWLLGSALFGVGVLGRRIRGVKAA